jgi:flagellar motor switch protein FliM
MAEAGRAPPSAAAMTPARALGQALAVAAQEMMDLPLRVLKAEDLRLSLAELLEMVEPLALLAVLEGPREALGLAALSPGMLASLIEIQTIGRIGPPEAEARRPTRTDAAMSAGFLDRALAEVETFLAADEAITWAGGFRYGSFLDDPRPLGLVLEEGGYRVLRLGLGFGAEAARRGDLLLALPYPGRGAPPAGRGGAGGRSGAGATPPAGWSPGDDAAGDAAALWQGRLDRAVMQAPAELHAVMDRISLPLSAVLALRPGALIELPPDAVAALRLEGADGRLLTLARLGQIRGHRAVRLKDAIDGDDGAMPDLADYADGAAGAQGALSPSAGPAAGPIPARLPARTEGNGAATARPGAPPGLSASDAAALRAAAASRGDGGAAGDRPGRDPIPGRDTRQDNGAAVPV